MCSITDLNAFGPFARNAQCGHLSFTLLFEESILTIIPVGLALVLAVLRIRHLWKFSDCKARRDSLCLTKLCSLFLLTCLQLCQLVVWSLNGTPRTGASIPTAAVCFFSTLIFAWLSVLEHTRSVQPSDILAVYFLVSFAFDVIRTRTLWIISDATTIAAIFTAALVLRFLIVVLESTPKRRYLFAPYNGYSSEATSGIIGRCLLWWLNPLFRLGLRQSLTPDSLLTLDPRMTAQHLYQETLARWNKANKQQPYSLLMLLIRQHKWAMLSGVFPRLCLTAFKFAQPFMVQAFIDFEDNRNSPDSAARGNWLIVAYAAVYIGIAISTASYTYQTYRFITMIRGSLLTLMYDETLKMKATDLSAAQSAPLTLMSADVEKIRLGLLTMHNVWASLIEMAIATWLLERKLGLAIIAPVLICFACIFAGGLVATSAGGKQKLWLEATQRRIDTTSSMISMYKSLKMTGLVRLITSHISELREKEVQISKMFRKCVVATLCLSYLSNILGPILGFGVYALSDNVHKSNILDSGRAFSSLTIFSLLNLAVVSFVQGTLNTLTAVSCLERYRNYLARENWNDARQHSISEPSLIQSSPSKSLFKPVEVQTLSVDAPLTPNEHAADLEMCEIRRIDGGVPDSKISVSAQSVSIGWSENEAVLRSLSFEIQRSELAMVIGGPSSGKSTLLKALLGQAVITQGTLYTSFIESAYCSQKPWLTNKTIRQNILGVLPMDHEWYNTVIAACSLDEDIQRLPLGDLSTIGSGGVRLSGGQRTRVALARALYTKLDALIIDDVTTGLDPKTANSVMVALFGPGGLLRRSKATVVLATSNDFFLRFADTVIDLSTDVARGQIHVVDARTRDDVNLISEKSSSTFVEDEAQYEEKSSLDEPLNLRAAGVRSVPKQHNSDFTVYAYYAKVVGYISLCLFLALVICFVFGLAFPQIWIAWWVKANERGKNSKSWMYFGVYLALGAFAFFALILGGLHLMMNMVPRSALYLHRKLLDAITEASVSSLANIDDGETVNRFSQDLEIVDSDVPLSGFATLFTLITCIAQTIIVCVSSRFVTAGLVPCFLLVFMIQKFYLRTSRQLRILDLEAKAPLVSHFQETLRGLITIQAFGWVRDCKIENFRLVDMSQRPYYLLACVQRWLGLVLDLLVAGVAVLLAILIVCVKDSSTSGFLGVALTSLVSFGMSLNALIANWTTLETAIQAISRIKTFSAETVSEDLPSENQRPPEDWPQNGSITFENVSASYNDGQSYVLKEMSFSIAGGEKIGICGRTGSGKSSLVATLARILDLQSGSIVIDGVDVSTIPRQELRSRIINVPQDPFLLPGTVRYNVDPRNAVGDQEIIEVLREVCLWDFLAEKGGLDADANEHLHSATQRQLLCFARALAQSGSIVVMDEATSSLDSKMDKIVQQVIRKRFKSRTVMSIAHKIGDLLDYDKIMVIDQGRIVEFDTPQTLQNDASSKFRDMLRHLPSTPDTMGSKSSGSKSSGSSIKAQD